MTQPLAGINNGFVSTFQEVWNVNHMMLDLTQSGQGNTYENVFIWFSISYINEIV